MIDRPFYPSACRNELYTTRGFPRDPSSHALLIPRGALFPCTQNALLRTVGVRITDIIRGCKLSREDRSWYQTNYKERPSRLYSKIQTWNNPENSIKRSHVKVCYLFICDMTGCNGRRRSGFASSSFSETKIFAKLPNHPDRAFVLAHSSAWEFPAVTCNTCTPACSTIRAALVARVSWITPPRTPLTYMESSLSVLK